MNDGFEWNSAFAAILGAASVKTIYSYLGYYNVCHLGGEIKNPQRNIPRSMVFSVIGIALLYFAMNISVVSVIPWQEAAKSDFIVSTFIEKLYGLNYARFATLLVLWVAFASLFAVMLGYSRVPYAAAREGEFFKVFGKLHPTKAFPHIALLGLGITAFFFSLLFKLTEVITAILAMRILIQFIGQAIGVVLLRRKNGKKNLPFKMPLYPLPVIFAITIWLWIFYSTGINFMLSGLTVIVTGIIAFLIKAKKEMHWPYSEQRKEM
jgi:amino acid transporter